MFIQFPQYHVYSNLHKAEVILSHIFPKDFTTWKLEVFWKGSISTSEDRCMKIDEIEGYSLEIKSILKGASFQDTFY